MRKVTVTLICLTLIALASLPCLYAEAAPTITISLYKNNGYGLGQDMSGQWTVNTEVSSDVLRVEFYLDNLLQQTDTTAPYSWQFNTGNYSVGTHTIKAIAYSADADTSSQEIQRNFIEDNTNTVLVTTVIIAVTIVSIALVIAVYRIKKAKK